MPAIIVQAGSINTAALGSPKAVVSIQSPAQPIVGVQINILGLIGVGSWGPVGTATIAGGNDEAALNFGPVTNRSHDLSTAVMVGVQQQCSNYRLVRVSDGTDTAAVGTIAQSETWETVTVGGSISAGDSCSITMHPTSGPSITITATVAANDTLVSVANKLRAAFQVSAAPAAGLGVDGVSSVVNIYFPAGGWTFSVTPGSVITLTTGTMTGSVTEFTLTGNWTGIVGNGLRPVLQQGTAAGSARLVISRPGFVSEVFDNILGAGNLFWVNLANAVNNGNSAVRGPSQLCAASTGFGAATPSLPTIMAMSGGTDGSTGVTDASLLGVDVNPRTGIYALRNQNCGVACPVDATSSTYWTSYVAFGQSEGALVYVATPPGDTLTNAATELPNAGVDSPWLTPLFGDWLYWPDQVNNTERLLSPATFEAAIRARLSPEQSVLNKPLNGIIGSQKTISGGVWSTADLDALYGYRLDIIANPCQGGYFWGVYNGINSSSNAAENGDNYTMLTNFLAKSIAQWGGVNIGLLQTPTQRQQAVAIINNFFQGLWTLGLIGNADSYLGVGAPPWSVAINDQTTPPALATLGYEIANIAVQYLSVIRWFIVNLMGGQTVQITVSSTPSGAFTSP